MSGRTVGSTRNPLQTLRGFVQGVESVYIVRGGDSREGGLKVNISGARALVPARRHFGPALSLPTFLLFISAHLSPWYPKILICSLSSKGSHQWEDTSSPEIGSLKLSLEEEPQNKTNSQDDGTWQTPWQTRRRGASIEYLSNVLRVKKSY